MKQQTTNERAVVTYQLLVVRNDSMRTIKLFVIQYAKYIKFGNEMSKQHQSG